MSRALQRVVETTQITPGEILAKTRQIYDATLRDLSPIGGANFAGIRAEHVERLFDRYDRAFFGGELRGSLEVAPRFRISSRMTRAAGKTFHRRIRRPRAGRPRDEYEIAVSSTLLSQTFCDVTRPITVSGIECGDRLEALQRVFEHELVHLVELSLWGQSRCAAARFQSMANRFFGHRAHTHQLITPRERALKKFGIRPGDRVAFRTNGARLEGVVNRITKRATVLVEDEEGLRYSDGKRYSKYYVRLSMLRTVEDP